MRLINSAKRYKAIGPYSQAVVARHLMYCSGVIGVDAGGTLSSTFAGQVREIFLNLDEILAQEHLKRSDVVKTTCFLTRIEDFVEFNKLYTEAFGDHRPARSTVQVAGLPKGALVEIEVIAHCRITRKK